MKKYYFILLFILSCNIFSVNAQYVQDLNGSPIVEKKLSDLSGSPYFNDLFLKGSLKIDGTLYKDLYLRYDQLDEKLVYKKDQHASSMEPIGEIAEFTLQTPTGETVIFRNISIGDAKIDGFYQLLQDGLTALLKKTKKVLLETVAYNSAGTEKSITSSISYYILKPNHEMKLVKKDRKDFLKVLSEKSSNLEMYIKSENVNFKSDLDMAKVVAYYNSLK